MSELTTEQIEAVEGIISRRMENMKETRKEACAFIGAYLLDIADGITQDVCSCCGAEI
jgi:hypothetical protein